VNISEYFATSSWVWVDYTIAGVTLLSAVMGFLRGIVKEVYALFVWGLAFWVGSHYSHELSALFQNSVSNPGVRVSLAFILLFIMTLILGGVISLLLSYLLHKTGLSGTDRILGFGFGLLRGYVLVAVLIILAGFTALPQEPWWKQSKLLPPVQSFAVWLKEHIPSNVADYIKFR
jgi:membrane protein required for colicin V production